MNTHEEFCLLTATHFTAVRRTRTEKLRKEFASIEAAKTFASTYNDKRTMIYAINDLGNSAHICNA